MTHSEIINFISNDNAKVTIQHVIDLVADVQITLNGKSIFLDVEVEEETEYSPAEYHNGDRGCEQMSSAHEVTYYNPVDIITVYNHEVDEVEVSEDTKKEIIKNLEFNYCVNEDGDRL